MEEAGGCASTRPQPVAILMLPGTDMLMAFRCSRCCRIEWLASANAAGLRAEENAKLAKGKVPKAKLGRRRGSGR